MKRACLHQTQQVMDQFLCEFYPVDALVKSTAAYTKTVFHNL
ncbi:MAG: hypothetical protein AB2L24_25505 [Mangrovibacterium sp.]